METLLCKITPKEPPLRNRMIFTAVAALAVSLMVLRAQPAAAAQPHRLPNVVLIYMDDMGWADIGPFGAKGYETPNIDRMAKEGTKFTSFYSAECVCSASRAAIMTGCYPPRVGFPGVIFPHSKIGISDHETTLAQIFKQKNYRTMIIGKWHLGDSYKFLPLQHGFDEYFGLPYSNDMTPELHSKYPPLPLYEGNKVVKTISLKDQDHLTTWYTEHAVKFIKENKDRPFFLYLPHSMVHIPIHCSDKFRGKTKRGLFGDVMEEVDWSVGQVLDTIKQCGIDDNTLVIFCADNGPWLCYGDHAGSAGPLREGKMTSWDGGVREPTLMRWPGHIPAGRVCDEPLCTIDILPTVAKLIGATLPDHKIDGLDISSVITNQPDAHSPHDAIYFYRNHDLEAVRAGKWKLELPRKYASLNGRPGGTGGKHVPYAHLKTPLALYDLSTDIGEHHNVAEQYPDVVKKLMVGVQAMRHELGDGLTHTRGTACREPGRL